MKIQARIRIFLMTLSLALLLPVAVSAALPPSAEIQWENTKSVTCDIIITGNLGTVSASITGNTGTTVEAKAILYEIIDGVATEIYIEFTPEDNPLPIASFSHEFVPQSGVTYYLVMNATVSKDGVDEMINDYDLVTIP